MILNDVWPLFNGLIQSDLFYTTQKEDAINLAQAYLIMRMIELGRSPDEFLSAPTNMSNTIYQNFFVVPSDFLAIHKLWRREGDRYIPLGDMSVMSYAELQNRTGENFFDSTDTASPLYAAVKEPNVFLDRYIKNAYYGGETITDLTSLNTAVLTEQTDDTTLVVDDTSGFTVGHVLSGGTSGALSTIVSIDSPTSLTMTVTGGTKEMKMDYYISPPNILVYDTLAISAASGAFIVGEVIYGANSQATANIIALGTSSLNIVITSGVFQVGELITGQTSTKTATAGVITLKPTTLIFGKKYQGILPEVFALMWHRLKSSNEVEARSAVVDNMIKMLNVVNQQEANTQWGTM